MRSLNIVRLLVQILPKAIGFALVLVIVSVSLVVSPLTLAAHASHWSYGGADNPTRWGRLDRDFALCAAGSDQSPIDIDIEDTVKSNPAPLTFHYLPVPLTVVNNGHTIQINYAPGSTLSLDGEQYDLVQFHFHTPSEHTVSGIAAPLELHLVHRNATGRLAVVGILMEAGAANPAIDTIWSHIPQEERTNQVEGVMINAADLLPSDHSYFSYSGSLTTPPCSEGVQWTVLTKSVQVSDAQITAFAEHFPVNARPLQPTNGRQIQLHPA